MEFLLGQRYVSDNEPELGLGVVVGVDGRRVHLCFGSADARAYATHAKLSRVVFGVGDEIVDDQGVRAFVVAVRIESGIACYTLDDGRDLMEARLGANITLQKPVDKLIACQFDQNARFELREDAKALRATMEKNPYKGLIGARVDILAHQMYVAHELIKRPNPRALLADEVGLGKTVQAGLVLHAKVQQGSVRRALVLVPDSLQYQWLFELKQKFNLDFVNIDLARAVEASQDGVQNIFAEAPFVLCSIELLLDHQDLAMQARQADFDMLIVDEAHHLLCMDGNTNAHYDLVKTLADTPALLLLTATPEQLGLESHFAHLQLLDNVRFDDFDAFLEEQESYSAIAQVAKIVLSDKELSDKQIAALAHLLDVPMDMLDDINQNSKKRTAALGELLDRHGTGRVLFRNTRQGLNAQNLASHHARTLIPVALTLPDAWQNICAQDLLWGAHNMEDHPKALWLLDFLRAHKDKQLVLIARSGRTVLALECYLRERGGVAAAVFTEDMSLLERDQAAAFFASGRAQILLCSEIGSEGRNFQFVSDLILFDLPPSPDTLEQRIGRLDRIGQKNAISIYLPYFENSSEAVLMHWYRQALGLFDNISPTAQLIHTHYLDEFMPYFEKGKPKDDDFLALVTRTRTDLDASADALLAGRDILLEYNSCRPTKAQKIVDALKSIDDSAIVEAFFVRTLDVLDIDFHKNHDGTYQIFESDDPVFAPLFGDGMLCTFARKVALMRYDVVYISYTHPVFAALLEAVCAPQFANASVVAVHTTALPQGALMCEFNYAMQGVQSAQMARVLVSAQGDDLTQVVPRPRLLAMCAPIAKPLAGAILKQAPLAQMAQSAHAHAHALLYSAKQAHLEMVLTPYDKEITRLQRLAQISDSVPQAEIDALCAHKDRLYLQIMRAEWILDSVRAYIVVHD